jgi:uncharacterized protein
MNILSRLHSEIEERVQSIRSNNPDWPCRMGCDTCCRQLADIPKISAIEWELLKKGLAKLPEEQIKKIRQAVTTIGNQTSSIVCPLLDQSIGACCVYQYRPVVCRTYGFYVRRGIGIHCKEIESLVNKGSLNEVVWGNHDVIDHQLCGLGETRALNSWFTEERFQPADVPK